MDGSNEVIMLLDDDSGVEPMRQHGRPREALSVNGVSIDTNDDDDIEIVEATCVKCKEPAKEHPSIISLSSCRHSVHFACCVKNAAVSTSNNLVSPEQSSKRRKTSITSPTPAATAAQNNSPAVYCPKCSVELDWIDFANALSRRQYLESGLSESSADDKAVGVALHSLLRTWKSQLDTGAAKKGRKTTAKSAASKAKQTAGSYAWAGGTGYGGNANEKINTAAIEKSQQVQRKNDEVLTKALVTFNESLRKLSKPRLSTEALLRRRSDDLTAKNAKTESTMALVPFFASYLINGPSDVVARSALYLQLLDSLLLLGSSPCLAPLLVSSTVLPFGEAKDDADSGFETEFLLLKLNRLMEALKEISADAEGAVAFNLATLADQVKAATIKSIQKHPHFRNTVNMIQNQVQASRSLWKQKKAEAEKLAQSGNATIEELTKAYKASLDPLQFRAISLIELCGSGLAAHSFVRKDPTSQTTIVGGSTVASVQDPSRMGRIRKEIASLKTSMPLEWNSSIFCAVDETRPDVLQFLIVGPEGTPYQNGCFLFDCYLSASFPSTPPHVLIQTTGGGQVRFNPNLYKDGKVCLSLLGTWSGPGWDAKNSTLLQVLVSIQSLIMVSDPYFNEPGFEASMKTPQGQLGSEIYNANIRYHTVRLAMTQAMMSPSYAFQQIIKTHFTLKRKEITEQLELWKTDLVRTNTKIVTSGSSSHFLHFAAGGSGGVPDVTRMNFECDNAIAALNRLVSTGSASAGTQAVASSSSASAVILPTPFAFQTLLQNPDDEDEEDDDYDEDEDAEGYSDSMLSGFGNVFDDEEDDEEEIVDLT